MTDYIVKTSGDSSFLTLSFSIRKYWNISKINRDSLEPYFSHSSFKDDELLLCNGRIHLFNYAIISADMQRT